MKWGDAVKSSTRNDLMTVFRVEGEKVWTYWFDDYGVQTLCWDESELRLIMGGKWEDIE